MEQTITEDNGRRGEVLVAIMNNKADFVILQDKLWYRIPVKSMPKPWPPRWLAFYQTKVFGAEAYSVRYYGRVQRIDRVLRKVLFPDEFENEKTNQEYYQIHLDGMKILSRPVYSARWRRIIFIPTTWLKLNNAVEINDLYHESPLEDHLWLIMKGMNIGAERQWDMKIDTKRFLLDFAVFCVNGNIDVETDGDTYHANPTRAASDNERNNALTSHGWQVLRFNTHQVMEEKATYCVNEITRTVNHLGGLSDDGLVPRVFYNLPGGTTEQLTLFDKETDDDAGLD